MESMRTWLTSLVVSLLALGLSGCSLLSPGKKEFFQKTVPTFPERVEIVEKQKQAAQLIVSKVNQAYDAGLASETTNSVMQPLHEARDVAQPLATSLGAPEKPYKGGTTNFVTQFYKLEAKYDAALEKLADKLGEFDGKKIEGTGLIQMGYFTWLLVLVGIVALLWFVLKMVAIFNPPVAVGMSVASAGANLLRRGFGEVIEAGEAFKNAVKAKIDSPEVQQKVLELFRNEQEKRQSRDVQHVIKQLTKDSKLTEAIKQT